MKKNILLVLIVSFMLSSCKSPEHKESELRLGYLLNMTHAVPMIGLETGRFKNISGTHFLAGGYLINSLITGNIDLGYIGPGPFINACSKGVKLIVVSGSSSGGNSVLLSKEFVEKHPDYSIDKVEKIAVPQLGNTQDLLAKRFLDPNKDFISINPAEIETAFFTKAVEAAVVPEPWGTILESKGAALIESSTDEMNKFPAAMLVVDEDFYDEHRVEIDEFILEHERIMDFIAEDSDQAVKIVAKHLGNIFKKRIQEDFLKKSLEKISFSKFTDRDLLASMVQISRDNKYIRKDLDIADRVRISETNWEL